jgi:hypothetical protein
MISATIFMTTRGASRVEFVRAGRRRLRCATNVSFVKGRSQSRSVTMLEGYMRMRILSAMTTIGIIATASSALAAEAGPFDGIWNVTIACSDVGGIKGYDWRFQAEVRGSQLSGKVNNPDNSWGVLSGKIANDGAAQLTMVGNTGNPAYSLAHAKKGTPINYHASAHFDARSGAGKRVEQRPCDLTFTKN